MATQISYDEGDEISLDATNGMAVANAAAGASSVVVLVDNLTISRDAAAKALIRIARLIRENDYPMA